MQRLANNTAFVNGWDQPRTAIRDRRGISRNRTKIFARGPQRLSREAAAAIHGALIVAQALR